MISLARSFVVRALACALAGAVLMLLAVHFCVPAVHADPLVTSTALAPQLERVQSGWDVIASYGWIWGGMLVLYVGWSALLRKNESAHWIAQGRALALLVAGAGVLGSVLEAKLGGAQWSGVVVTLVAALKMVISPTVTKAPDGPPKAAGTQLSVLLVLLMASAPLLIGGVS